MCIKRENEKIRRRDGMVLVSVSDHFCADVTPEARQIAIFMASGACSYRFTICHCSFADHTQYTINRPTKCAHSSRLKSIITKNSCHLKFYIIYAKIHLDDFPHFELNVNTLHLFAIGRDCFEGNNVTLKVLVLQTPSLSQLHGREAASVGR